MALPIVLNSLDLQGLAPKLAITEAKRHRLQTLNEAMNVCHQRYTGTVAAVNMIKKTIETACSEHSTTPSAVSSPACLPQSNISINDWFDVFVYKPAQYLRISMKIDISFCTGRYPDTEGDLPRRLVLPGALISTLPTSQSLFTGVEDSLEDLEWFNETDLLELGSRSHLDFLDFNEL